MNKIIKAGIDLVESITLTSVIDTKFWQDLIITLIVIISNAFIIPLVKYLFTTILNKMRMKGIISDEEFKQYCITKNIQISEQDVRTLINMYKEWKGKRND